MLKFVVPKGVQMQLSKQIDDKGYLLPYKIDNRKLIKVGVSFNKEERNVGEWGVVEDSSVI